MRMKSGLCMALAAVLALSLLAGCGGAASSTPASTAAPAESVAASQAEPAGSSGTVDLTIFVDETWWRFNTWEGKIPEAVTEITGVRLKPTVAVDDNQLSLMISSGDMTDLICSWRFDRLSDSSLCYSYNELIEEYAPDFEVDEVTKYVNTTLNDGNFYVIKNDFASPAQWAANPQALHQGPGMSFRQDILDDLGNPTINSIEALENAFDMVLDRYDGAVLPIVAEGMGNSFRYMKTQLAVHGDNFYEDDAGELVWKGRDPQLLEWYKLMNEWYHKGYWAADNLAFTTSDQYKQVIMNGEAFCLMAYDNTADTLNTEMKKAGLDYYMKAQVEYLTDDALLFDYRIGWRGLFITRNCADPKAAINFAKYAYSDDGQKMLLWGVEGEDWHYGEDGYPVFDTWNPSDAASTDEMQVKYWGWLTCSNIINGMGQGVGYEQTFEVKRYLTDHTERKVYIGMANPAVDSEESSTLSRVNDLLNTEGVKILLADNVAGVEAAYATMIDMAESMGLSELEAWANSVYPDIKEGYFAITDE